VAVQPGHLVIDLVPHLDAGDRTRWSGDQDERPLSDLGRRQASVLAEALAVEPVTALVSSPARRCLETLEPVAHRLGLPIETMAALRETDGFMPPAAWADVFAPVAASIGGATAAGRGLAALRDIAATHPEGRVIACSHGDLIPALVACLAALHAIEVPPPGRRGGWHRVLLERDATTIDTALPAPGFPT
jgi:broad specificity phosphatase PhoE